MNREDLAKRIRQAREALDITRYQAAKRMGVSRITWNRWESSRSTPNVITLQRIAVILKTTQAALLGEGDAR